MSKPFRYWTRLSIVATISATLIVSPAWAGRLIKNRHCGKRASVCCEVVPSCAPAIVTDAPCCDPCSETMIIAPSIIEAAPSTDCGCDNAVIMESTQMDSVIEESAVAPVEVPPPVSSEHAAPSAEPSPSVSPAPSEEAPSLSPADELESAPAPTPPAVIESTPAEEAPADTDAGDAAPSPFADPADDTGFSAEDAPAIESNDAADESPAVEPEPATEEAPADNLFGDASTEETAPEAPATEEPATDLFGDSVEEAPAEATNKAPASADEGLFGSEPDEAMPAEDNAGNLFDSNEAPAADDNGADLFGEPADASEPAADDAGSNGLFDETPAEEAPADSTPADDSNGLFGDEPAADASENLFGESATSDAATDTSDVFGAEASPTTDATDSVNDLFGDSSDAAEPTAPADDSAESLFDAPATEEAPASDLFDTPATESSDDELKGLFDSSSTDSTQHDTTAANGVDFNDLFGEPAAESESVSDREVSVPVNEEKLEQELNDLFETSQINSDASFEGAEERVWVDNTGNFTVRGRLLTVHPSEVRLLKDNGNTTTVPIRRLSAFDREYVQTVVAKMQRDTDSKHFVHKQDSNTSNVTR